MNGAGNRVIAAIRIKAKALPIFLNTGFARGEIFTSTCSIPRRRSSGGRSQSLYRMAVFALCALSSGVAASASYDIYYGKGVPQCEYLAAALKKARIGDMTDTQLCQIQQKPIEQWLNAEHIHDLAWQPYPASDPVQLERSMIESVIPEKDLPKFSQGISNSLAEMKRLSADGNFRFRTAPMNFPGQDLYVLQLEQKRCPNVNGWSDTEIGNGLFFDKSLQQGVRNVSMRPGRPIYFFGKPATLFIAMVARDGKHKKAITAQLNNFVWDPKVRGVSTFDFCTISTLPRDASGE